ncbi:DUF3352 domain-containing protein [Oculatella sp. LEGE 06141]|uniref:DUF3352 domain-containing protein n=1 Tax=Oculatella sp. LEGE 06141 TaxID=1828648 RepID=UPI00188147C8|nr:DUF3352 domain-containing protein [Oculatella sp. LEGE 06141]MBE9177393.1 DUF3352 domain-containing protein [Oculatella sp. LEGE 06141]
MMLKPKKPALLLTLGAAIALISGGAVGYWLTTKRPQAGELPAGITVIPQDALVTLSFSTDEGQWRQLRTFGTPESRAVLDQNLIQWRDRLLTDNGYNYQQDIRPWIGREMTIAFLSAESSSANASAESIGGTEASSESAPLAPQVPPLAGQQTAVMVLPIADPVQAQQTLARRTGDKEAAVERDYKGLKIQEFNQEAQPYAATVLDGRFLVVSSEGKALEQVIDTYKGEESVTNAPGFVDAFRTIAAPQPFMQVYVNVPAAKALAAENSVQPVPSQNLAPLQDNQGLAAAMTLQPNGVHIEGVTWLNPESEQRYRVTNEAVRMPSLLPAETSLMASGGNLQRLWEDYSQRTTVTTSSILNPNSLRQGVQNFTGLNLDDDLMPWMSGEFSLSLLSHSEAAVSPGTGVVFMVRASDRRAAEQTLEQLDGTMRDRYNFQVNEADIEGQSVVNWISPFAAMTVTRGWMDGNVLFLAFGTGVPNAILPAPDSRLADQPLFQEATVTELNSNNGNFYVDIERLTQSGNGLPLPILAPQQQIFISAIRSIGVTTAIANERSTRYDINVLLQSSGSPAPLAAPSPGGSSPPDVAPNAEKSPASPDATPEPSSN